MLRTRGNRHARSIAILSIAAPWIVIGLGEFAARQYLPYPKAGTEMYRNDPRFLYFHRPNMNGWEVSPYGEHAAVWLRYNRDGFRGDDLAAEKPAGERRVFVLGDSYVEARQFEEELVLTGQLARRLDDGRIRVVNAGCSAYTTTTAYLLLKHHILKLQPDVVLYVFGFNDYCDNYWYGKYCDYPDAFTHGLPPSLMPAAYADAVPASRSLLQRIQDGSVLLSFLGDRTKFSKNHVKLQPWQSVIDAQEFHQSPIRVNKRELGADERRVLDFTHQGLVEMQRICREGGVHFQVAILPCPLQVGALENRPGKLIWGYRDDQVMEETVFQERLLLFCREHEIDCVDLLPAFKRASSPERRMFLGFDGHLTPAGHAVAAEQICAAGLARVLGVSAAGASQVAEKVLPSARR